jgi:hypothetical protein
MILYNGTTILQIRSPELGDSESLDIKQVEHITIGGNYLVITDDLREHTYKYQFTTLTSAQLSSLVAFIVASQGRQVKVTDHFNRVIYGFLVIDLIEELTERDDCSYSLTLDLLEHVTTAEDFYITDEDGNPLLTEAEGFIVKESYYANI